MSLLHSAVRAESLTVLSGFRADFYNCLTARADGLFELADPVLRTDGLVRSLVELALAPEHRRGHGSLYAGLNRGRVDVARLRRALAGVPLPRAAGERLVLAVDVSPWLRPGAGTVPDRSFCHTYGRGGAKHQIMPGWPYSVVVARPCWTRSAYPGRSAAPAPDQRPWPRTGPTPRRATEPTYADAASQRPSRRRSTSRPTGRRRARPADGQSPTTTSATNSATPSNATSRRSRPGAVRPPSTTSLPTATRPDSTSADRSCG